MFHPLTGFATPLPAQLNCPMCYVPHAVVRMAAKAVNEYIAQQCTWHNEIEQGKMFGALVVRNAKGEIGFLAAFSGNLCGTNRHEYFVPPVFDFQQPNGYYKTEEAEIMQLSRLIENQKKDLETLKTETSKRVLLCEQNKKQEKAALNISEKKKQRDALRQQGISALEEQKLIAESQYLKAEAKRIDKRYKAKCEELTQKLTSAEKNLNALREMRSKRSQDLQHWLFEQFEMLNARGEKCSLNQIFLTTPSRIPPSGAGECCAPKLLQYAFSQKLTPIAMGEWWLGTSPKGEVRHAGQFYPACHSKCEPILDYMLQGLDVEPNPLRQTESLTLRIVYEDDCLIVVDKPSGLCSVAGRESNDSVVARLRTQYPNDNQLIAAHRLDMDTSGLLVVARNKQTLSQLQQQFATGQVVKGYEAMLCGSVSCRKGTINLPLTPDITDRPRQKVDLTKGKKAVTEYEVVEQRNNQTRILFRPLTGRTHQLRVHAAHAMGLGCPIVGDNLYGSVSKRLMLHAKAITFVHPKTQQTMHFASEVPF